MKNKIDSKLDSVYEYIEKYIRTNNFPPSVREISAALSISSTSTIFYYLKKLESQGRISRTTNKNRAISLPAKTAPYRSVPLVGSICAGDGILAVENIEGYYPLPAELFSGELFMLRVSGASMKGAGINDGDYLVVRSQSAAENGNIVVALIGDTATVKRLVLAKNKVILHPENPDFDDMVFEAPDSVNIQGIVVANIHKF